MKTASIVFSICVIVVLSSTVVLAKGSIGIYAIIDKVAFEPNEDSPERIRIWGVFVVPVPMSSGEYKPPKRGYLYFKIAPGSEKITLQQWSELKNLVGTGQAVGFGHYWVANPDDRFGNPHHSLFVRVHQDGDGPVPDIYPEPHVRGIVTTNDGNDPEFESIMTELRKAAQQ